MTLMAKAVWAVGLGVVLMAAALVSGISAPEAREPQRQAAQGPQTVAAAAPAFSLSPRVLAALVGIGVLAVAGTVGSNMLSQETIRREGRDVHIALAPVDPRSLMQGDYMTLRFAMPSVPVFRADGRGPVYAVATLDETGLARIGRFAATLEQPRAGEVIIELTQRNGVWVVATDAFFFKEGDGARYAGARFGAFRLMPDGRISLTGLLDGQRRALH
jgi:uncharacterized membrane-anchored protein